MIEYIEGNIFDSPAQVIVNTVNTVGVMGKGIALEFKNRYPQMFEKYKIACEKKMLTIGKLMLVSAPDHMLLLFPTKENWRYPSKLSYIEQGLKRFCDYYAQRGITSVAFPKLGCGNGELNWDEVRPLMEQYLRNLPIDVYVYLNKGKSEYPEHKHPKEMQEWLRKNAKDLSFFGVLDDVRNQCTLMPYEFTINSEKVKVKYYNESLQFEYKGQIVSLTVQEFFTAWDDIRNRALFILDNLNLKYYLLCNFLTDLGYLSKIKKQDRNGEMAEGVQVNEGLGRAFVLNEVN
jgi:appr-1-p processing domain protein